MQVSIPVSKQKRSVLAGNPAFLIHASLLGGFVALVGYFAVIGCHHVR
ncbi:MAG: hypothetical protein QXX64_02985 [Nitrososphaera sp.]|nr:hypothetical protein [Candidatus Nitrososphaera gargensis]